VRGSITAIRLAGGIVHILLVDDSIEVLEAYSELLEDSGYRTTSCETGLSALIRIGAERPDLVVLDLKLADISGLDVHRALRADPTFCSLPILFVSGVILDEEVLRAQVCDPEVRLLLKPIHPDVLIRTIREVLDERGRAPEAA
jgi:CheY-like chemotaxis protein